MIQLIGLLHFGVAFAYFKKMKYVITLASLFYVVMLMLMIAGLAMNKHILWGERFSKGLEK